MFLRKMKNKQTGRTYLSIVHSYRDKETKKTRSKTIESLGYLDELEKEYDDPIAFFEDKIKQMNQEFEAKKTPIQMTLDQDERIDSVSTNRKNLGYAPLSQIYHELNIHNFLKNRQRHLKSNYDANAIMKLLVFNRLLLPGSKKYAYENKELFFENSNFSLDDVYRSLSFFTKHKNALQLAIHHKIKEKYTRKTDLVYYDVTNYYFEIDEQDELRKKGVSKEHRPDPLVQMGLFMDTDGIPITYGLYPGNQLDKQTFIPMLGEIQRNFSLGRTVVVADRGMTTGDNIWYTLSAKNGYVLSTTVRGAKKTFKDYVLDESGYRSIGKDFKVKSRLEPREIWVTSKNGKKIKKVVDEKQVIFYSGKYARKAKADRAAAIAKAKDLVNRPTKYNQSNAYGASKYIKNLHFDKSTGEILTSATQQISFDEEKLKKEEELDGYYAIVTSEYKETDERIIEIYRGLWKIEETFKVTKSELSSRPVYLSREEHIEAHFLTCFISLVIARILEKKLEGKYSVGKILNSLKQASCSHIKENYYLFDYYDDILEAIHTKMGIDLGRKYLSQKEIKKILADVKKG